MAEKTNAKTMKDEKIKEVLQQMMPFLDNAQMIQLKEESLI